MRPIIGEPTRFQVLQWGRARAGADIQRDCAVYIHRTARLQWGRARAGADIRQKRTWTRQPGSLQWGRARAGADMTAYEEIVARICEASMGPRPRGRGYAVAL